MKKTVAIIQARMSSTRLPGKVLREIGGRPTLDWVVEAARQAQGVDEAVVATSVQPDDSAIAEWALGKGVAVFRGDLTDVLSRFLGAAHQHNADVLVRLTGDCPLLDPVVIGEVIKLREIKDVAYATNTDPSSYPDGLDVEVFTRDALECAHREAMRRTDRDTVTRFIVRNRHRFPAANLVCSLPDLVRERWVLDSPEDYDFIRELVKRLEGVRQPFSYLDILNALDREPHLRDINKHLTRNERFYEDLKNESAKRSFSTSKSLLSSAESLIPLGAQTFSKSKLMFPEGATPLFVTHGDGGYVFDVDGNDYVDLVGGLLPNVLGYRDPDVDQAIRAQLSNGISFSLATPLEEELAAKLNYHIPSAEMVRFGKNGSDVTTAAVRLARYITCRKDVVVGGYHGWHDWSTPNTNGVPDDVKKMSLSPDYIEGLLSGSVNYGIAAIIIEPEFFTEDKLRKIRDVCTAKGIILIFDEIISGFRMGMGGLQRVWDVTPDLSTFGKAMANGMPISALVGKEIYMKQIPEISYSGTFFGETLSIAASIATIDKLYALDIPTYLHKIGSFLRHEVNNLLEKHGVTDIELYGDKALNRIKFRDKTVQSLFIQEMAKHGVLIIGSHNTCYAHKEPELEKIIQAWDLTLEAMVAGAKPVGMIKGKAVR